VRRISIIAAVCAGLVSCKKKEGTNIPYVCKNEVAGSEAEEVSAGEVPAEIWFLIMLSNYNGDTKEAGRPVKDCSGREVEKLPDPQMAACLYGDPPPAELPTRPLEESDLMITPTEPGKMIVWLKTSHYDNGQASGPLGLAQWTSRGVLITAMGTLRAYPDRAQMRLEPLGADKVLVVESRVCEKDDPQKCSRLLQLLPKSGKTFVPRPLIDEQGNCLGPAAVEMYREKTLSQADGSERKFELSRSIDFAEGSVVINEQVTIKDSDPKQPEDPPELFRKASVQRPLRLTPRGLVTKPGLWDSMIAEHGSVELQPDPKPEEAGEGEGGDEEPAE
jgi:hypothetical protein